MTRPNFLASTRICGSPNANFASRTLDDLLDEFQVVRAATIHFAKHLDAEALARRGNANGHPVSVRALFYIIAGHERHHARAAPRAIFVAMTGDGVCWAEGAR